ncbi:SLATT domain-containing protein [Providencia rettgeri]|uniref:SLATT domain-containing protein n=1 Tax=Providencia rettgeri TaxID=587 RepID=UPI0032DBEF3F
MNELLIKNIRNECFRIEEDSQYSSKSHYNISTRWDFYNNFINITIAILSALAGLTIIKDFPVISLIIMIFLTCLTALNAATNPSKRASIHKVVAGEYNCLKNDVRVFREIELLNIELPIDEIKTQVHLFSERRNQLNRNSPNIPRWAYTKTQSDFNNKFNQYDIDKEKQ